MASKTGKALKSTASAVRKTAKVTSDVLNFCTSPFCLHNSKTAKCKRKCCK